MLAGAEDHLATFSFPGVSQTIVTVSAWGQCPQVLAGTARKVAKSTRLCSYAGGGSPDRVARGLPTGGQGSKVYVLFAEPKEHKHFRPGTRPGGSGTRPGGSVTGVTEKLFMCQMFMCLFWPLICGNSMDSDFISRHVRSREIPGTFRKAPDTFVRKVWVSIKFLFAKFGFTPSKRAKMRKNCTNQYKILKIDTF